ncbi:MAG: thiolase family protein [Deltaproteobacteria bacterium]|uniref:propanoyl-CoA C-acyltransferase n=1 Tax=Candidatus Zymogenus saltonus TaxID=2844893 RepID=A0A9D8KCQ8_9DELT|nr:thiolase family protein [Candidatus Zymogenus saltonus]
MKERVYIIGVGMTKISKQGGSYEEMAGFAVGEAMSDAGLSMEDMGDRRRIGGIWYANCAQGMLTSQHSIRGQVVLRRLGFEGAPMVNVENACASATTALNQAVNHVVAGVSDLALAVGIEKMTPDFDDLPNHPEIEAALPYMGLSAFWNGCEQDRKGEYIEKWRREKSRLTETPFEETDVGVGRSPFMDYYAVKTLKMMERYGWTQRQLACVCAKTHHMSTMNPKAQYTRDFTAEDVLNDKPITYPLTRAMCAPTGEGCAAAVVCSERYLKEGRGINDPVLVLASVLVSGRDRGDFDADISGRAAEIAYKEASVTPKDIEVLELHDATTFGEIYQAAQAGFCSMEDAGEFCSTGATDMGGEIPTNTSGGLVSRGHPVGCTGLAQVYELVTQIRGRAKKRQVRGARVGMHINGGGVIGVEEAALGVHILKAV